MLRGQAVAEVFVVAFVRSQIEQGVAGAVAIVAVDGAAAAVMGSRLQVAAMVQEGLVAAATASRGLLGAVVVAALKLLVAREQQTRRRRPLLASTRERTCMNQRLRRRKS